MVKINLIKKFAQEKPIFVDNQHKVIAAMTVNESTDKNLTTQMLRLDERPVHSGRVFVKRESLNKSC